MRIFDSPWVLYCTNAFSVLVWFTILFLIVTIWVASPPAMRKFKKRMMKMAVSLLCSFICNSYFRYQISCSLPLWNFTSFPTCFSLSPQPSSQDWQNILDRLDATLLWVPSSLRFQSCLVRCDYRIRSIHINLSLRLLFLSVFHFLQIGWI
jgi:hypothetical protein